MQKPTCRTILACSAAFATISLAPDADAQTTTTEPTLEEVVVTGSLIRQPNVTATSPLTTVDQADFLKQDTSNIQDMLLRSPQVYAGQNARTGFTSNAGVSTLSLRNLGTNRTLVLIDGNRLAPTDTSGYGAADISLIPSILIKRVDIVTGGASAVYGSDALAGVVNFVMDRLDGFRADLTGGTYEHSNNNDFIRGLQSSAGFNTAKSTFWGGDHVDINFAEGITSSDGSRHGQAYFGYRRQEPISVNELDYSGCSLSNAGSSAKCTGSSTPGSTRFLAVNGTPNSYYLDPTNGTLRSFLPTDIYTGQFGYLSSEGTRYLAGFMGDAEIAPHAKAYASFMYMKNTTDTVVSPTQLIGTPRTINCDNGMLTSQELTDFCGGSTAGTFTSNLTRRNVEGAPRTLYNDTDQFRATTGINADFDPFHLDVHAQYTTARASVTYANDYSTSRVNNAIDGCVDSGGRAIAGCVPYNIFQPGAVTPAAVAYVQASGTFNTLITEKLVSATVDGDLGKFGIASPWANSGASFAVGTGYRDEEYSGKPDFELLSGDLETFGAFPAVAGGYKIKEVYGETRIPLISDKPLVHDLSVGGAFRVSDYTTFGSTTTDAFNANYAPTQDVRFRASYNRAIRAPSLPELYSSQGIGYGNYTVDGCEGATPTYTQAQCANTGVTAAQYGHIIAAPPGLNHNASYGGNPSLQPEKANTRSVGIVVSPSALRDFTFSVDWFDIKINGVINDPPPQTILDQCATTGQSFYCSLIHRDPNTGSLWLANSGYVVGGLINAGVLETAGIDVNNSYVQSLDRFGSLGLNLAGTYDYRRATQVVPGAPTTACEGHYGVTCGLPTPKWHHTLTADWSTAWKLDVTMAWRFSSAVNSDNPASPAFSAHIGSASYFDLSAAYQVAHGYTLRVGIDNLFDRSPPIIASGSLGNGGSNNTYPSNYDPFGRAIYAKISLDL